MSELLVVVGVLTFVAVVGMWMAERRFLRSLHAEVTAFGAVVRQWCETEGQRQRQMRDSAAAMQDVATRLREAVTRADDASRDARRDVEKLLGPVGELADKHDQFSGALGAIEHQVRELASKANRLDRGVPDAASEPVASVEALVLEMIRQRSASPRVRGDVTASTPP